MWPMTRPGSREERLRAVRRVERKEKVRSGVKWGGVGVAALVLVGGVAFGLSLGPEKPATVHWHPTWEVFVNGENVLWANPRFDMQFMGGTTHFHQPDDATIHAEGRTDRLYLNRLLNSVGGEISDNQVVLPQGASISGTFATNETDQLRVFIQPDGEDWREVESGFADLKFGDKMRVLVTYGHATDEEIKTQQESVKRAAADAASAMNQTQAPPGF